MSTIHDAPWGHRRAVLLGCGTYGLRGCGADVAIMRGMLQNAGFEQMEERVDSDATRAGVLDAVEWLIASTRPGDAALVYWSGHGGRVGRPDFAERRALGLSPYYQFLVPYDLGPAATGDNFAGLLSEEVTVLQWRLTEAFLSRGGAPNVTTVLDCCHAGYMARDTELRARAIEASQARQFPLTGIKQRAVGASQGAAQLAAQFGGTVTNPYAVRLVAAQQEQSAFEREMGGDVHGLFTAALVDVLAGLGEHARQVPWSVIVQQVRGRVQEVTDAQRPGIEGPGSVLPFTTEHAARPDLLPVEVTAESVAVPAADLLGLGAGDTVELVSGDLQQSFGSAEVERLVAGRAQLHGCEHTDLVGRNVWAVIRRTAASRRGVRIAVMGPSGDDLTRRVTNSVRLKPALPDESAFARVSGSSGITGGGTLTVLDELGAPVRVWAQADDDSGRAAVVDVLEVLARGRSLAELSSGEGSSILNDPISASLVAVRGTEQVELAHFGARVPVGERLSLRLTNRSDRQLYYWVFDIGVSGRISLITNAAPDGTPLGAQGQIDDTSTIWGVDGAPLAWPSDVPTNGGERTSGERPESFIVILADRRQDLSALVTARSGPRSMPASRALPDNPSELQRALDAVRTGVREMPIEGTEEAALQYRVERFTILVQPPS